MMRTELDNLYTRLAMVNKMAKEQSHEFLIYYEFYTIRFMMDQATLVKNRIGEIMNQIEKIENTFKPPTHEPKPE